MQLCAARGGTHAGVAKRKLAPVPSECWIVAEALASCVPAGR
jgi:hypothetical protein